MQIVLCLEGEIILLRRERGVNDNLRYKHLFVVNVRLMVQIF
jgi:hypothetical protein